ncbi:corrinoid protein [Bacillus benzoevorans]|uniref:Corrinoid protein of di/trimethylamine methyltransferase n=1 Tax=Bacillus benzoevorans TaxID=1456 RepID=A0A7X0LTY9_9BACI|nr:corrinoid protein [Bacillus benzoevorans]MBB6444386.1 corrinoid protein of di/trimethylamine methyltransferase [Bacillus benzoevorans]
MSISKEELLKKLSDCVVEMEEEEVVEACHEYLALGYPAFDGIMEGLVDGMNRASKLYEEEEYFVTDVLLCSDAMYEGLAILRPHLPVTDEEAERKPVGLIGVVEGDTHDIGKNLVKIMLETAGYEMVDLGRDVPLRSFVEKAKEMNAAFVCLSTLMTTTMGGMSDVVQLLKEEGLKEQVKVVIGGGPISKKYADTIGADGYASNAVEAVKLVNSLLNTVNGGVETVVA